MRASSTSTPVASGPRGAGNAVGRARPGTAGVAAAAGGVVLLGSLFLDWYRYPSAGPDDAGANVTGWQVLSATDILLAALAAVVILVGVLPGRARALRHVSGLVIGLAGIAALAFVVARLVFPPGAPAVLGALGISFEATRLGGVFVAFAAAAVMAAGGVVAASGVVLEAVSRAFERLNRDL